MRWRAASTSARSGIADASMARFYHGARPELSSQKPRAPPMPQSGHASIIRAERGSPYPGTGQNLGLDKEAGKMSVRQTAPANEHLTSPRLTVKDLPKIVLRLLAGAVLIFGLISLIGLVLTHVLNTGPFHRADLSADVWFADHRTKLWNQITRVGTDLARTETVIIATAVLALVLRLWLKRWHESVVLVITI